MIPSPSDPYLTIELEVEVLVPGFIVADGVAEGIRLKVGVGVLVGATATVGSGATDDGI